ncbi:MAG: aminotransferase class I/II-fold pyridoxal phosphate-dependent enzyme [Sulfobacillus sp.]
MPQPARRLDRIPPYLFAELDRQKRLVEAGGRSVVSFSIGDPDLPTADAVVARLMAEAARPEHHRYPPYEGTAGFRRAVSEYYGRRFGVALDPDQQVVAAIGSKEAISHLVWAYVDPGDVVIVPEPAYPVYANQTLLAGGDVHVLALTADRGFVADLETIPQAVAKRAKLLFLNYPHNPTGALADLAFFDRAVAYCRRYDILLVSDAAYVEMTFGAQAPSVLQVAGAQDVAVEFYSLSKPFNMTGWRLGAMVGQPTAVAALKAVKANTDSGQFSAIQAAGQEILTGGADAFVAKMNQVYRARRDLLVGGLRGLGWDVPEPVATFYLWAAVPGGDDIWFARQLLERAAIAVTPGRGFGQAGAGYVRFALTVSEAEIAEALQRLSDVLPALLARA